jgi:hypothetical protein
MSVTNGVSPAEAMLEPYEEVELGGKTRRLYFGFNTLCELQTATGTNPFEDSKTLEPTSPVAIRLLVWACLWREDPRPSLEQVGAWLLPAWDSVVHALARLQARSTPDPKKARKRRPQ